MSRSKRAGLRSLGFCAILLAVPALADVEVSKPYASGSVTNKKITVEGVGVGDKRLKGTDAFQRAGETAALLAATRNFGELVSALSKDLDRLSKEGRQDHLLQAYTGIETIFSLESSSITSNVISERFLIDRDSSIVSGILRIGSADMLWTTIMRGFINIEDTLHLYIGNRDIRVYNLETTEVEAVPAVTALLKEEGFQWNFETNSDGSVTCRLMYPVAQLQKHLEAAKR